MEGNQLCLQNLQNDFALFQNKFDISVKEMNNKLVDIQYRLDNNDHQIKRVAKSLYGNIQQVIETGKANVQRTMEAQQDIFQRKLTHLMDTGANDFQANLQRICDIYENNLTQLSDQTVEAIQKEIFVTSDDATSSFNKQVESATANFLRQVKEATNKIQDILAKLPTSTNAAATPAANTAQAETTEPIKPQPASRWNVSPEIIAKLSTF